MRSIKIKKATLSARSLVVDFEEVVNEGGSEVTNLHKINKGTLCHEDLIHAFNRLKPHFALLCDFREVEAIQGVVINLDAYDFGESLDKVFISGVQISYAMDHDTLTIVGGKTLPMGRCINLSCPSISDTETDYSYVPEIFEVLENIRAEVRAYLFDGKCAVKQAEMDFDMVQEEEQTEASSDSDATPSAKPRGRRKKGGDAIMLSDKSLAS